MGAVTEYRLCHRQWPRSQPPPLPSARRCRGRHMREGCRRVYIRQATAAVTKATYAVYAGRRKAVRRRKAGVRPPPRCRHAASRHAAKAKAAVKPMPPPYAAVQRQAPAVKPPPAGGQRRQRAAASAKHTSEGRQLCRRMAAAGMYSCCRLQRVSQCRQPPPYSRHAASAPPPKDAGHRPPVPLPPKAPHMWKGKAIRRQGRG